MAAMAGGVEAAVARAFSRLGGEKTLFMISRLSVSREEAGRHEDTIGNDRKGLEGDEWASVSFSGCWRARGGV